LAQALLVLTFKFACSALCLCTPSFVWLVNFRAAVPFQCGLQMATQQMNIHRFHGHHQGGQFIADGGFPSQKSVAAVVDQESVRIASAHEPNFRTQVFRRAFEEQALRYRATMMGNHSSVFGFRVHAGMPSYSGSAPPHHARTLGVKTTVQYGADDLFESVFVDDNLSEETVKNTNLRPPLGRYEAEHYPMNAKIKPPPGLEIPSGRAGAPSVAGMYVHGAAHSGSFESFVKDWQQTTHDSLATVSTNCDTNSASGEQEEMAEEAPKKKKNGKQRFCKAKRDRYRHLVEGLVEHAKDDPASFDLSEHKLPPGIASSEESKAKLLATVMKFAMMKFAMAAGSTPVETSTDM